MGDSESANPAGMVHDEEGEQEEEAPAARER